MNEIYVSEGSREAGFRNRVPPAIKIYIVS
jgi:hypothetical protein